MATAQTANGAAPKKRKRRKNASRKRRRAPAGVLARARSVMSDAVSPDIAAMRNEIDQLMNDLEDRMNRLNAVTKRGAGHAASGANDLMMGAISGVTDQLRNNVGSVSDDVAKIGTQALKRIAAEVDHRPLLTLAIAAGIGFLAGLVRRD